MDVNKALRVIDNFGAWGLEMTPLSSFIIPDNITNESQSIEEEEEFLELIKESIAFNKKRNKFLLKIKNKYG